jgi:hypothetical protein
MARFKSSGSTISKDKTVAHIDTTNQNIRNQDGNNNNKVKKYKVKLSP